MSDHGPGGMAAAIASAAPAADAGAAYAGSDFLARAARTWTELPADADACLVLGEQVRELVGDCIVLVGASEPPEPTFRWRALVGDAPALQELSIRLDAATQASAWPLADRARRKDGTLYDLAVYSNPIVEAGRVTGMRGIGIDITRSTRARQAQEESERRFRELVDLLPVGVVESDPMGNITFANAHMTRMTGYTPDDVRAGLRLMDLVVEADRARVRERVGDLATGETHLNVEYTARRKDRGTSEVAIFASPMVRDGVAVGVRGIAIDITARKRAEEQQRRLAAREQRAQKLESLGVLTPGIAHDFNNLLIAVLGNAELALRELSVESAAYERIAKARRVAQRAAELVSQLLTYSGGGAVNPRRIDLNEVMADVESLLHATVAPAGVLRLELASGLPPIEADASQIRQVAMNLVINAAEAITEPPGRIEVRTGLVRVDAELPALAGYGDEVAPGQYVFLEVRDTGCGMDPATAHRMFEPFFTTKFAGRGLGLASVQGIVRGHRGAITVTTAPGQGTTLTVLLPPAATAVPASR